MKTSSELETPLDAETTLSSPGRWKLTEIVLSENNNPFLYKWLRVIHILLHFCLMCEAAFLLALAHNLQYGAYAGILRPFVELFLPSAPAVSVELAMGVVVVSYPLLITIGVILTIFFLCGVVIFCFGYKKILKIVLTAIVAASTIDKCYCRHNTVLDNFMAGCTARICKGFLSSVGHLYFTVWLLLSNDISTLSLIEYAIVLGVVVFTLIITAAITLGGKTFLPRMAVAYMQENLVTYNNVYSDRKLLAVKVWGTVMKKEKHYCCGLNGYMDFLDSPRIPRPCCSEDGNELTEPCTFSLAAAMSPAVPGCKERIEFYVDLIRPRLAVAPVSLLIPPVLVLIAVLFTVFC